MKIFFRARLRRCSACMKARTKNKRGSGYESSNSIYVCVVIDHFMNEYCSLMALCTTRAVRETRQDQSIDRVKSSPSIFLLLRPKHITQLLSHAHFLSRMHSKLKILRRLKNEHNSASKTEPTHLLARSQRLTVQNR